MTADLDTDVIVVGSGFGGAVAALRFAEAGQRVTVLERGAWIERDGYHIDLDWFWLPHRNRFGMHDIRRRGKHILPWLGAGVGGGSHVYAGTLKRAVDFSAYPPRFQQDDLTPYFERAEAMMGATPYPDYPPYNTCRSTQLLFGIGERLQRDEPGLVEAYGAVNLAVTFAPEAGSPGGALTNAHGSLQRYYDPREQSLLGGDIDAKNTLDHNYLHLAQQHGATIEPMCQVETIEPLDGGGYRVHYKRWMHEPTRARRWLRKWRPRATRHTEGRGTITARRVVVAAGSIGSTELLLRNRDVTRTLPGLSAALGEKYTTNGDSLSLILPFRGVVVAALAFAVLLWGLITARHVVAGAGAAVYYLQLLISRKAFHPDRGTTNSDYIRFRGLDGEPHGAYLESGRYPTPLGLTAAVFLSVLGLYTPRRYGAVMRALDWLWFIPPLTLLARCWPIPLLKMGKDRAFGRIRLDARGEATIDYDLAANRAYYAYLDELGRKVARAGKAWWIPNVLFRWFQRMEVPHNQGGAPMAADASTGVVDHAGRVFGYDDLLVLDGAILPASPGPNPALTILAVTERAMDIAVAQLRADGTIKAAP